MAERFMPRAQEIYRHFKGNLYQVQAVAEHTETGEQLVIYQALYGDFKVYARPLDMFTGLVDREKYPDADQVFRFQLQGPEAGRQTAQIRDNPATISLSEMESTGERENADAPNLTAEGVSEMWETEEPAIDPLVLEFLDARTYEQRLNVLAALHHRITNEMITTMSLCCDIEVEGDDVEQRYEELKQCLMMKERFEIKRLV